MINRVVMVGRMTKDPMMYMSQTNHQMTRFTLAMDRGYTSNDGQEADFINVVCWDKTAENVDRYCQKGSLVGVEGRLRSGTYLNSQGQKVFTVDVIADRVQFIDTRRQEQQPAPQQSNHQQQAQQQNNYQNNYYGQRKPVQNETQNDFYETETQTGFYDKVTVDPTGGSFEIMDDDIQF